MGQLVLKDNAASTLTVALTALAGSGQTVTIAGSGSSFPTVTGTDWSYITLYDGAGNIESMKVTAHAVGSTTFTVSRGTAAGITSVTDADVKAWSATTTGVACRLVSQVVLDINDAATSAAASASAAASSAADAATDAATVTGHIAGATAAHAASAISYAGASGLSATDVEAALDELDAEKQALLTVASQAEMEDGTETALRSMSPLRVAQAIAALAASTSVPVRQTVLSGPTDSSGLPSFGGSTGSTTVTASGTLIATAANGFGSAGQVDRIGSITNPSWTGLSTNGTMYLYLDIASDGTCTTGSGTLEPSYQFGGTYSTTSGKFTFNVQEMVGKVGDGSAAAQTYRVYVGQVTVSGGVVSAIVWYALMGRYDSGYTATLPSTGVAVSKNSNIGVAFGVVARFVAECTTADNNFVVGDVIENISTVASSAWVALTIRVRPNTVAFTTGNAVLPWAAVNPSGGAVANGLTNASWKYKLIAQRTW